MARLLGLPLDATLLRYAIPTSILLAIILYYADAPSHIPALTFLPSPDTNFITSLLTTSTSAAEYYGAPFGGRAFQIPHRLKARVDAWIPPVFAVEEGYDVPVLVGPEAGSGEKMGPLIPRVIYQTWKTDVVGVKMMQALTSWIEMNPE